MGIVELAYQIIDMQRKITRQEREIDRLLSIEQDYNDLLKSSINHSAVMHRNMLDLFLTPGVLETCLTAKED